MKKKAVDRVAEIELDVETRELRAKYAEDEVERLRASLAAATWKTTRTLR